MALLDQYVAPGLRLWMLIGLVSSVLLTMIVIVCCFVRLRIPRTKRQIEQMITAEQQNVENEKPKEQVLIFYCSLCVSVEELNSSQ
jgi:hypothetical protein